MLWQLVSKVRNAFSKKKIENKKNEDFLKNRMPTEFPKEFWKEFWKEIWKEFPKDFLKIP